MFLSISCVGCAALPFRVLPGLLGDIHLDVHDLEDEVAFSQLKVFSRQGQDVGEERLTGKAIEERVYAVYTNQSSEGIREAKDEGEECRDAWSTVFFNGGTFRVESFEKVFPSSQCRLLCVAAWQGSRSCFHNGRELPPAPMTRTVSRLRDLIHRRTGVFFDGVLLNLYKVRGVPMLRRGG